MKRIITSKIHDRTSIFRPSADNLSLRAGTGSANNRDGSGELRLIGRGKNKSPAHDAFWAYVSLPAAAKKSG